MWWYSKRMRRHPINWEWSVFLGLRSEGARPDVCKIFRKILITTGNIWVVYQRQRWDDFITYTLNWTFLLTLYEHLTPLSTQIALIKVLIVHKVLITAFIQHRSKVYPLKLTGCLYAIAAAAEAWKLSQWQMYVWQFSTSPPTTRRLPRQHGLEHGLVIISQIFLWDLIT